MPSLILIDGGIGSCMLRHRLWNRSKSSTSRSPALRKKEEILYILGQEDEPCILDRHSPVLHLIQQIRDETPRFAVSFHRQRRSKRQTKTALSDIPPSLARAPRRNSSGNSAASRTCGELAEKG